MDANKPLLQLNLTCLCRNVNNNYVEPDYLSSNQGIRKHQLGCENIRNKDTIGIAFISQKIGENFHGPTMATRKIRCSTENWELLCSNLVGVNPTPHTLVGSWA
jgi:hypothetical protein